MADPNELPPPPEEPSPSPPVAPQAEHKTGDGSTAAAESLEVSLTIELPTGSAITLPTVHKNDGGLGIKQALQELPDSCFYTAYALVSAEDPTQEVKELTDLGDYPFIKNGARLRMVLEDYDLKTARMHVRRFRELLMYPPAASHKPAAGGAKESKSASKDKPAEVAAGEGGRKQEAESGGKDKEATAGDKNEGKEPSMEVAKAELRAMLERFPSLDLPLKLSLETFYPTVLGTRAAVTKETMHIQCVRSITYSGWNPPPSHRRMQGDLLYLEIRALDDAVLHVTATPQGFYVNKTLHEKFDPSPAGNCYFSHELMTLLLAAAPSFKKAWTQAVHQSCDVQYENAIEPIAQAAAEGRLDTVVMKPPWAVPPPPAPSRAQLAADAHIDPLLAMHKHDLSRCEDELSNSFGVEDKGVMREWNEDYQNLREMGVKDANDKLFRAKVLHKVMLDYAEAVTHGATAVLQGMVPPINPTEPRKSHVFVYNNIFFSHAVDAQHTFKLVEGDAAAFKGALHELRNLMNINKLEIPKLYTLATSVVDYLGVRLVAQSIIPGVLNGEQQSRLMYGAVEPGCRLRAKKEAKEPLREVAKRLFIAERKVPAVPITSKEPIAPEQPPKELEPYRTVKVDDEDENDALDASSIDFVGPVEWKAIRGADGRVYVLDLVRLTPWDPNWITGEQGTGVWEAAGVSLEGIAPLEEEGMLVLRQELITTYVRAKQRRLRDEFVQEYRAKTASRSRPPSKKGTTTADGAAGIDDAVNGEGEAKASLPSDAVNGVKGREGEKDDTAKDDHEAEKEQESLDEEAVRQLQQKEEALIESLKVNPNAFLPVEGVEDVEQWKKDEEYVRRLGRFLWDEMIPMLVEEVKQAAVTPVDGEQLTETLHQMGINVRYLGRLATLAKQAVSDGNKRFRVPTHFVQLCEHEMLSRSTKHVIFDLLRDRPDLRAAPAPTLVACLNALLGNPTIPPDSTSGAAATRSVSPTSSSAVKADGNGPLSPSSSSTSPRNGGGGSGKGGSKKAKAKARMNKAAQAHAHAHASAGVAQKTAPPPPTLDLSLAELRELIVADVRRKYRYDISMAHATPNPLSLLRRVCQKLGLRVYCRAYDFATREPFTLRDVMDVTPTTKHCTPPVVMEEAKDLLEHGRILAQTAEIGPAFECTQEALTYFQQLAGPIHVDVARCLESLGGIFLRAGDAETAVVQLQRALAMFYQTTGMDSFEVINTHHSLAMALAQIKGRTDEAVFHLRACVYLLEMVSGPDSPELTAQYFKMGGILHDVGLLQQAYHYFLTALEKAKQTSDRLQEATMAHQVAILEGALGMYKQALANEKRSYAIYKSVLGERHAKTIESSLCMSTFTQKAVELATDKQRMRSQHQLANGRGGGEAGSTGGGGGAATSADDSWTADIEQKRGGTKKKGKTGRKK